MNCFKSLHGMYRGTAQTPWSISEYISSPVFLAYVESIDKNVSEKVRLTLALLSHISLDCLAGTKVSDFVDFYPEDGQVWVCLQFHCLVNLVGDFTLSANTIDAHMLANAIQDNLDSKKFKAAQYYRKHNLLINKRCARFRQKAQVPSDLAREQLEAKYKTGYYGRDHYEREGRDNPIYREDCEQIFNNYMEFVAKLQSRLASRVHFVNKQAFDIGYQGSFHEIMVNFVSNYLAPASARELATA